MIRTNANKLAASLAACAAVIALCLLSVVSSQAMAGDKAFDWHIQPHFYLAGMTTWSRKQNAETSHDTVAAAAELRFRADALPWHANLFVEYKFSTTKRFSDIANLGAYVRYDWRDWDMTTAIYAERHHSRAHQWIYAGRLRYRIAQQHKIGLQAAGPFAKAISPTLFIGYYGSVSETLSVHIIADPGINGGPDVAVRTELVWQLR